MFYSFRNKLFAISLTLLALFMLGGGIFLHESIRGWTESRIQTDLTDRAALIAEGIDAVSGYMTPAEYIDQLEKPHNQRVTLVDDTGTVVADTYLDEADFPPPGSHADRPEVRAAADGTLGLSTRHSDSVDVDMLYAAIPLGDEQAVLRVAVPLKEIDEALSHLRMLLFFGALLGIGVAIAMSSIASAMMSQVLHRVVERARRREPNEGSDSGESPSAEWMSFDAVEDQLEETLELLVSERNRFRAVLDGMNEGVIAIDDREEITLSNRAAGRLLETDEITEGSPVDDLLPDGVTEQLIDDETDSVEFEVASQPPRTIHILATPRPDSAGHIFVLHDVTTIRRLETMRRDFVANVSHELKTPVTVIQANAETLLDGAIDDPEHARSFTEGIHRNAERLSHLIGDLLDLSRIESGQVDLEVESLSVADVVDRAVDDVSRRLDDAPAIDSRVDRQLDVRADFDALYRVVLNLVENAVKYGDGKRPVEIDAHREDDTIVVEVGDDGPGIDEQHRDRIFERFYRVDSGRASDRGGTGLGLSIVKHLVDSMNGDVGYRAGDDGGSVFWFSLPEA